ncbi:MAG: Cell division inhibitor-like protein [Promethearchaeota archaeon]|nr:MAG: Cell division inhibitor-like protein [Candidatus Lokiarchaeota archaeon]
MNKKVVGVISGKGGVGKTSLTASLVSLANEDPELGTMVMDCDVDAPNLSLIMPAESEEEVKTKDSYTSMKASFLEEKCIHCKACIEEGYCEFNALNWDEDKEIPIINYLACEGCSACKVLCPEHAFEISPVKSGEIISYTTKRQIPLIYGKTRLGSTTSGKLVSECKSFAEEHENFEESDLIIIDGPPGIGCPVIATVSGLDYIIAICEPTPSGLHDVVRAIEVINSFEIPFGIVVNKHDLKSPFQKEFQDYIENTGYEILGKIPFDLEIPRAMSFAKPIVDYKPDSKAAIAIKEIYQNLKKQIWNSKDLSN